MLPKKNEEKIYNTKDTTFVSCSATYFLVITEIFRSFAHGNMVS